MPDPETPVVDPPVDTPATPALETPEVPATDPPVDDPEKGLGEAGKAALDRERAARRQAEKDAKALKKRLDDIDAANLSETEKLTKEAEELRSTAATATEKLRRANLLSALADAGLTGGKAKAAARLIDGVEFDDDDEPTNLTAAIKAARATYGEELFTAAKADPPALPDTHAGARTETPTTPETTGFVSHKIRKEP